MEFHGDEEFIADEERFVQEERELLAAEDVDY
jgi:hypothetical protein